MSVAEVVADLLTLDDLVTAETDADRRRSLRAIRERIASRADGAKVSEAATLLGVSQPTVRSWIDAGLLPTLAGSKPVRVDVGALAATVRALDLVRPHAHDRRLLVHVMRLLRDRAVLDGSEEGSAEVRAGRVVPLSGDLRAEMARQPRPHVRQKSVR